MTIGLLLAAVVGLALGLLGGGGSVLAVPIFVYVLDYGAKEAIAMSLAVVGLTSLVAAVGHWRAGNVNVRVAAMFGPVSMAGAYGGARLATLVSGTVQLIAFAVVMLVTAVFMFRGSSVDFAEESGEGVLPVGPIIAEALLVGVMTGFVGVGGGFLVVPVLALLAKVPMRVAIGTSLAVIALNAGVGFTGYLGEVEVPWLFMGAFAAVATAGGTRREPTRPPRSPPRPPPELRRVSHRDGNVHPIREPRLSYPRPRRGFRGAPAHAGTLICS